MKIVCESCKFAKGFRGKYCKCVKYGIPMRLERIYCVSYERDTEQVWGKENRSGRNPVRFAEGSKSLL